MEKQTKPVMEHKNLIFVTGNAGKFAEAQKVAERYGIDLRMQTLDIVEIQSSNPMAVAKAKAEEAYRKLRCPVVVHDASWSIPALKGFPGAYMHDMVVWFEPEDWLNLMRGHENRAIEVCENVTYCDENGTHCCQYRQKGVFADSPRGANGNSLEKVVILADNKTIAEHHDTDIRNNSVALRAWEDCFGWISKQD